MGIDAVQPIFREIAAVHAVPQLSLTRRERELQVEEGQPPMEVASAERDALRWQKNEDLQEKWKKRNHPQGARHKGRSDAMQIETPDEMPEDDAAGEGQPEPPQTNAESQEEETGTLFDDRS